MFPRPRSVAVPPRHRVGFAVAVCLLVIAGCGAFSTSAPAATPTGFQGIAGLLVQNGLRIDHVVSGDAGCEDQTLKRTAIALDASGLDQATPTRVYIYIFRDRAAFDRLRQTVDTCARAYATNPDAFESVEASPYVVAGPGPWGVGFKAALRSTFSQAAGTGG
jgi:hypothetical protein